MTFLHLHTWPILLAIGLNKWSWKFSWVRGCLIWQSTGFDFLQHRIFLLLWLSTEPLEGLSAVMLEHKIHPANFNVWVVVHPRGPREVILQKIVFWTFPVSKWQWPWQCPKVTFFNAFLDSSIRRFISWSLHYWRLEKFENWKFETFMEKGHSWLSLTWVLAWQHLKRHNKHTGSSFNVYFVNESNMVLSKLHPEYLPLQNTNPSKSNNLAMKEDCFKIFTNSLQLNTVTT